MTSLTSRVPWTDPYLVDGAIAAALTVLTQGQLGGPTSWAAVAALPVTIGLAWRRSAPLVMVSVVALGVAAQGLSAHPPADFGLYLSIMLANYSVAVYRERREAILGLALLAVAVILHDVRSPEYGTAAGMISDVAIPVILWGVGRGVRFQRAKARRATELVDQLEQDRQELARVAVLAERVHIARELHDVVTHSVSVVVIQAQGAQRALDCEQPEVRTALESIETAGRTALNEMRRLLGLLRDDDEVMARMPQPALADVPHLLDQVRAAGLPVRLIETGEPVELPPGIALTAYRIVQEALTNALKYAAAREAVVTIGYGADQLQLAIADNGRGSTAGRTEGRGLVGMRERIELHGGALAVTPGASRGVIVTARLPLREAR